MVTDLKIELEPTTAAPVEARRAIGDCLGDSLTATTVHELRVVATELVANAVEHGPGEPIQLWIAVEPDGTVRGEVDDRGSGRIALAPGGLGLRIVDALADSWAAPEDVGPVRFELSGGP